MPPKIRADQRLVALGLAASRTEAQAKIASGLVFCQGLPLSKPASLVDQNARLTCKDPDEKTWVSRGGKKLDHAVKTFGVDLKDVVALDVGASTGGFTDVLLFYGAARVYAVDVGYGQLDQRLREDPRVIVHEKTNARSLSRERIPEPLDVIVCDASFIGLRKVLTAPLTLARPGALLMALIKPQFEAGRHDIGNKGVVSDPLIHLDVCNTVMAWLHHGHWQPLNIVASPIRGPEGNQEYIVLAKCNIK
jgi:23S rRNA (cytidine1920-2'-O)/16S rRNA (cytidine1409-2'-O)-methyltransferase